MNLFKFISSNAIMPRFLSFFLTEKKLYIIHKLQNKSIQYTIIVYELSLN